MSAFRKIGLWFARLWWAQHNARVLADMEWRMSLLVEEATGGRMSKPYYSIEQMRVEIAAHAVDQCRAGQEDANEELIDALRWVMNHSHNESVHYGVARDALQAAGVEA